jgi:hypothetical protein
MWHLIRPIDAAENLSGVEIEVEITEGDEEDEEDEEGDEDEDLEGDGSGPRRPIYSRFCYTKLQAYFLHAD